MTPDYSSLPKKLTPEIRDGKVLAGDDFDSTQLAKWFSQEQEAYFQADKGHSKEDPWYAYRRYVNERLGFSEVDTGRCGTMLVLGPASGAEVKRFARDHPNCKLTFLEASDSFQVELRAGFPDANIISPQFTGEIDLPAESQDLVVAFSVLHHIPNVTKVVEEIARVSRRGGIVMVREPCSSMGDWRFPRIATPNERGISRPLLLQIAARSGLAPLRSPIPILLEPINKLLKKTIGFDALPFRGLFALDRALSWILSFNDHYWRDSLLKKIGPSSYFYLFIKR